MPSNPKRAQTLKDLSDQAVFCHAFGHGWDDPPLTDHVFNDGVKTGRVQPKCDCGTVRSEYVTEAGDIWGRSYDWPDFYHTLESVTRKEYKAEWFRRRAGKARFKKG